MLVESHNYLKVMLLVGGSTFLLDLSMYTVIVFMLIIYIYILILPLQVLKAQHQSQVWYEESQQNEALCEKLKLDAVEKECELAHTKELCSELQRHIQEIKQVHNICVEEDPSFTSPG